MASAHRNFREEAHMCLPVSKCEAARVGLEDVEKLVSARALSEIQDPVSGLFWQGFQSSSKRPLSHIWMETRHELLFGDQGREVDHKDLAPPNRSSGDGAFPFVQDLFHHICWSFPIPNWSRRVALLGESCKPFIAYGVRSDETSGYLRAGQDAYSLTSKCRGNVDAMRWIAIRNSANTAQGQSPW
jgi:hypothetical protein